MKYQADDLACFSKQIEFALANYSSPKINLADYNNIILAGLGGSGIAGRIIKSLLFANCPLPVEVISDYELPAYAGKKTLAIMSSYSGNTEETLSMYAKAKANGCSIICICTGGKLAELANADGYKLYKAEAGFQPRMALGYSLSYLLLLFGEITAIDNKTELKAAAVALVNTPIYLGEGYKFFDFIKPQLPAKTIIVTDYFCNPIGLRFCQQLQENAKVEAFLHELPEVNHNVIESYYGKMDSVFFFINAGLNERTNLRFGFLKSLLEKNGNYVISIEVQPNLVNTLEVIYTLDWISLIIANHREVNSSAIHNINALKEFLGKN
ncbi:MAG: SIS domain-containing protein [Bacteroidetes bacterium]|nr:SIS domain-containing protein [Bacteroidota bacterium]